MNRFNRFAIKYLIYCSPLMIIGVIGRLFTGSEFGFFNGNGPVYQIIGFFVISWFVLLTYYFFALVFNEGLKDKFVRRLTGLRENDEREAVLTGAISKRTFVSMIAALALLLFLSLLRIDVYRASEAEVPTGKGEQSLLGLAWILSNQKTTLKGISLVEQIYSNMMVCHSVQTGRFYLS